MGKPQILWLRRDLRLIDQAACYAAAQAGPVVPVFVLDDERPKQHRYGGASRWWLHHSLLSLSHDLQQLGSRLILRRGDAVEQLLLIAGETGADVVHAIRHYEPWWRKAQGELKERADLRLYDGNYLMPPGSVTSGSGRPYKIFTPFSREVLRCYDRTDALPVPTLSAPEEWPVSDDLEDWKLLPSGPDWSRGLSDNWQAGTAAALDRLDEFVSEVSRYKDERNLPSLQSTSRLSPHLHFGEISPHQVWRALDGERGEGADSFRRELIWRDYAQNVICQVPDYAARNYREEFDRFPWRNPERDSQAAADLRAWQQGRTGYPIVDAGMRELWTTGWMHNRVRMIAASFLIKHLLIDWRHGERWFWDTLVDADYATNAVNWQWVAGSGVDANMFVRIMAPLSQSEKFEAGDYIRKWVPELAGLQEPYIHDPEGMGCRPATYPKPLVGHKEGRLRAMDAYHLMKDN